MMLGVIFLTRTSMGFQFQSIAALTPFVVPAFDLSYAEVGLLMGLFMLPGVVIALPGGLLGQRFGSLRVVIGGARPHDRGRHDRVLQRRPPHRRASGARSGAWAACW